MAEWNPTCDRFVAFFDIMGFKDMVFRDSHAAILKKMNALKEITRSVERDSKALNTKEKSRQKKHLKAIVLPVIFSDSILLISEDGTEDSAARILFEASYLLNRSFEEGIPIKGALAYGEQTADFSKSLHFGRPLIDAWMLQEELHMYGAVLHHSMESYLKQHNLLENEPTLCYCRIPLKGGKVNHYCIDIRFWNPVEKKGLVPAISEMYNTVSGSTRLYVDNTIQFVNDLQAKQLKES